MIFLDIEIKSNNGIMNYVNMIELGNKLKEIMKGKEHHFWVLSGRLPVWCYVYLSHILHPVAGVGVYVPRDNGYVVIHRHRFDMPVEGTFLQLEQNFDIIKLEI